MPAILFIAYIAVGIAQIWAFLEGMNIYFGIGGILAFILLLVGHSIPLVGTLGVAFVTYYGARYGWRWEWWEALLLAAPGVVLMVAAITMGGLASILERRTVR
jgi:hypothetical protein